MEKKIWKKCGYKPFCYCKILFQERWCVAKRVFGKPWPLNCKKSLIYASCENHAVEMLDYAFVSNFFFLAKERYCLSWWKKTKHLCVYPIWQNVIMQLQALLCGCQMLMIFLHLQLTFWGYKNYEAIFNQKLN